MGTLQDLLYDPTCSLSYSVRLKMVRDVAKGVAHLHSRKPIVIHR
jgi:serine/threonine protein kinase